MYSMLSFSFEALSKMVASFSFGKVSSSIPLVSKSFPDLLVARQGGVHILFFHHFIQITLFDVDEVLVLIVEKVTGIILWNLFELWDEVRFATLLFDHLVELPDGLGDGVLIILAIAPS